MADVLLPRPRHDHLIIGWTDARTLEPETAAQWVTSLPAIEQARFTRIRHVRGAHEFLTGRLLVRRALASLTDTPAGAWQFADGPYGRPEIAAPPTPLRFNLAHSGGVVACILSDGREAGVDVEDLGRRAIDPPLWHRYCAPAEIADIEAQPEHMRQQRFLTYWTLKEAYLKARGLGIAVQLADIAFSLSAPDPVVTFRDSLAGTSAEWAFGLTTAGGDHLVSWGTPQPAGTTRPAVSVLQVPLARLDPAA
jgi:4'-phosphopantetheinyl transferase